MWGMYWMAGVGGEQGGRIRGGGRCRMAGGSGGAVSIVSSRFGLKGLNVTGQISVEWLAGGVEGIRDLGGVIALSGS